ncbi:hypothetical protein ACFY3E_09880 [Streptomyces griseorubiginosus]|uniref:hypothetical protein n=1 Tax=Streptomyces griseorubiginosus TaxID=67304 RepID=UPI00367CE7E2
MPTDERDQGKWDQDKWGQEPRDQEPRVRRTHLSAAGLRARGWTAGMIRRLLGEPDLRRANPYFRTAPPTRLYSVERVEAVERSEEFRAVAAVAVRRSGALREAALRRRRAVREAALPRLRAVDRLRSGPEIQVRSPPPAPDDRKVARRSSQEPP